MVFDDTLITTQTTKKRKEENINEAFYFRYACTNPCSGNLFRVHRQVG